MIAIAISGLHGAGLDRVGQIALFGRSGSLAVGLVAVGLWLTPGFAAAGDGLQVTNARVPASDQIGIDLPLLMTIRNDTAEPDAILRVCGRPGTAMPFFTRGAYDEVKCHDMNRQDAGAQMPPEGGTFLRPKDIEAVTDYVIAHIKGAGEPTYAECVAFFASASRVCDVYKTQGQKPEDATASTGKN
jgi:hypothetical protein